MYQDSAREGGADLSCDQLIFDEWVIDSAREGGADLSFYTPLNAFESGTPPARAGRI